MKMYGELAAWWPLLSAPSEYDEESGLYADAIEREARRPVKQVLELGSGGGNNASFLKKRWELTLTDLSDGMLAVSRELNPECEHIQGDMRMLRLERTFDAVLVHDAVMYMTTEDDLLAAITTTAVHLRPGGVALFVPDHTIETYRLQTSHGGTDQGDLGLRYLEWNLPPSGTTAKVVYSIVVREGEQVRSVLDEHVIGLFPRATWLALIERAGLEAEALPYEHSDFAADADERMFLGRKPS